MNTFLTVLTAVLVFGFLIFIHEFGHYIFARIFRVSITEFSIGMGPKLLWYDSKKTGIRYTLAMFPIGGFVAMVGEDEESDDPNAFHKKPSWQRFIITLAGAAVNILAGVLAMVIFTSMVNIGGTKIHSFASTEETGYEISSEDSGLMAGDEIYSVGGKRVRIADELSYEIMRRGNVPVEVVVVREGERVPITVTFPVIEEQGTTFGAIDFYIQAEEKTFFGTLSYAFQKSFLYVRMCWESILDLLTGRFSFAAVSGPVGISSAIGDAVQAGFLTLLNLVALISINLGVMNLLPIPALDGGRLLFLLFEMITRKKLPAKVEGVINGVGLILLLGLSFVVLVKDVIQLFL